MILPKQIRAARALLGISQTDMAEIAQIGVVTVRRIEGADDEVRGTALTLVRIQRPLEANGVLFIDQDDKHGAGVRLKKRSR